MRTVWKIGHTHLEADAVEIPDVLHGAIGAHEPLARLPLSPRRSGGGVRRTPIRKPSVDIRMDVPVEFCQEHLTTSKPVYLWITHFDERNEIYGTSCNQYLIARASPKDYKADTTHMTVHLSPVYRGTFTNTQDLLDAQRTRPDGDFVNENCGCRGVKEGFRDWIERVFRKSPYTYSLSQVPARQSEVGADTQVRAPGFYVSRISRSGRIDWQCICGAWTQIEPMDLGKLDVNPLVFADARSAHDHVRRLRNGVPQNWELVVAFFSLVSATALVFGEIIWPLINSHLH